jgi:hypothetical protein
VLPFLAKKKQDAGVIVQERQPDEKPENDSEFDELAECARDLMSAIERKDHKGMADAFHAMFQVCEEIPHAEGEHIEPHSYDAQKEE